MNEYRRLFYGTWAATWLIFGCIITIGFSYLPGSYSETFNFEAWFVAFPIGWSGALSLIRAKERIAPFCLWTPNRKKSAVEKLLGHILAWCACGAALPFLFIFCITSAWLAPFSPKFQVEHDHGVRLPDSVSVLHRENSGVPWMDSHASADVVIAASDLPEFQKQLEPASPEHLFNAPWRHLINGGGTEYNCRSKSSDGRFYVIINPLNDGRVAVKLNTVTD